MNSSEQGQGGEEGRGKGEGKKKRESKLMHDERVSESVIILHFIAHLGMSVSGESDANTFRWWLPHLLEKVSSHAFVSLSPSLFLRLSRPGLWWPRASQQIQTIRNFVYDDSWHLLWLSWPVFRLQTPNELWPVSAWLTRAQETRTSVFVTFKQIPLILRLSLSLFLSFNCHFSFWHKWTLNSAPEERKWEEKSEIRSLMTVNKVNWSSEAIFPRWIHR